MFSVFKDGGYKEALSAAVDCIPILGNAKAAYETIVGKDPITGRKLEPWERVVSGASVFGGPAVKIAKRVGGIAVGGKQAGGVVSGIISGGKKGNTTPKPKDKTPSQNNVDDFNPSTATNKQKGNYGEIKSSDNLLNNQSLKDAGYDLKPIGRGAPSSVNDKIVKGIDGLYENTNSKSNIKYVIDEAKFGSSQLSKKPKDGPQMSDGWLTGAETGKSRILKAVDGDKKLADKIEIALEDGKVERVLSTIDSSGKVKTYRIDAKGDIIGEWP